MMSRFSKPLLTHLSPSSFLLSFPLSQFIPLYTLFPLSLSHRKIASLESDLTESTHALKERIVSDERVRDSNCY